MVSFGDIQWPQEFYDLMGNCNSPVTYIRLSTCCLWLRPCLPLCLSVMSLSLYPQSHIPWLYCPLRLKCCCWRQAIVIILESISAGIFNVVNVDVFSAVDINCVNRDSGAREKFILVVSFPIALILVNILVMYIRMCADANKATCQNFHVKICVYILFIVYPSVSATVFTMWNW